MADMFQGELQALALTGISPRTHEGTRPFYLPTGAAKEVPLYLEGCRNCVFKINHAVCSALGYEVPENEEWFDSLSGGVLDRTKLLKLLYANWILQYVTQGVIGWTLYNAGVGSNISQEWTYEIVSCSNRTLTLKGKNPKFLSTGYSVVNPNWPGEAPAILRPDQMSDDDWATAKYGRLITMSHTHGLRLGSQVQFLYPSCLVDKNKPWIVDVTPPESDDPDDVTFTVEVSHRVSKAREPYDRGLPPGDDKYYCKIFAYELHPEPFPNIQSNALGHWAKKTITVVPGQLDIDGFLTLTNTGGENTKVLFPGMTGGAFTEVEGYGILEGEATPISIGIGRFSTTYATETYETRLYLTDFFSVLNYDSLSITYYCKARSSDKNRVLWYGHCHNSQNDPSGSYNTHGSQRCTQVDCDGFANYHENCWLPNADKFGLPSNFGAPAYPEHANVLDASFIDRMITGISIMIEQGMPGTSNHRNFSLVRKSWASLGQLLGTFFLEVPQGYFPSRYPWHGFAFGRRIQWDGSEGENQAIVHGAFVEAAYDYSSDGGPVSNYDASDDLDSKRGFLAREVTGWDTQHDNSELLKARYMVHELQGGMNLYTYEKSSAAFGTRNVLNQDCQTTVVSLSLDYVTEDSTLGALARNLAEKFPA